MSIRVKPRVLIFIIMAKAWEITTMLPVKVKDLITIMVPVHVTDLTIIMVPVGARNLVIMVLVKAKDLVQLKARKLTITIIVKGKMWCCVYQRC